jgi:copper resistance protein D
MAAALIVCRFLHFSAAMLLFGASTFTGLLAPPGLREDMQAHQHRLTPALVLILLVTALMWLGLEAGEAGNGWSDTINPGTIAALLTETAFGQVWVWRLVLAAMLLGSLALRGESRRWTLIILSAAFLASLGFAGHAAMEEGDIGLASRLNQAVHLVSAGFWMGCLPPLLVSLARLRTTRLQADATTALIRFSGLGHGAVALVLFTGIVNTWLDVGGLPLDFSSPYQLLLTIKIGLVGLMIIIAITNRYVVVPRLAADGQGAHRAIVIGTIGELVVGAIVIALVSAFATLDPM